MAVSTPEIYDNIQPGDWAALLIKLGQIAARLERLEAAIDEINNPESDE